MSQKTTANIQQSSGQQPTASQPYIGQPRERTEGRLKVLGKAPYAYEQPVDEPLHLYPLTSTIAKGRVLSVDTSAARAIAGVQLVMTHKNAPKLLLKADPELYILQSDEVQYYGQFLGAVVATSPESARHAASLVRFEYLEEAQDTTFDPHSPRAYKPKHVNAFKHTESRRGEPELALKNAPYKVDVTYTTPYEFHSPIEPPPLSVRWNPPALNTPRVVMHDSNQGPMLFPLVLGPLLGLLPGQINIQSPYVGGSFGSKGMPHSHITLVTLAAKLLPGRWVKYAMTRQQMFRTIGYRPQSVQRLRLSADSQGKIQATVHEATSPSAHVKEFVEQTATPARLMYASPNLYTVHHAVALDLPPATFMRAPGEFTGMLALEMAMDELSEAVGLDPIEFRILNEPPVDPEDGKPWSSRHLVTCLREGAKRFGWEKRQAPRTRREGEWLRGMGVAAGTYPDQHLFSTRARIRYHEGRYKVELQASDIGTGAYTILGQIAADALKVTPEQIDVVIGGSELPLAMGAGGSMGTYTWGSSVMVAGVKFREKFGDTPPEGASLTSAGVRPKDYKQYSRHTFGAHFAEVKVSAVTGEVRVERMLGMYDAGRIINPRTARSQFIGGMTMGLSAALFEDAYLDTRFGQVVNHDLAGYHVTAHADMPDIEAHWLDIPDPMFGPTGAKGIGEVGIVGVPAAIGNAIYNATGKRLRDLPFTPDKLL